MQPITVILTAAGSPGASTCIRHLRGVRERTVRVVGADANPEAIGRGLCDEFHLIPASTDAGYIDALIDLCARTEADCLIPASSYEVNIVAEARGRFASAAPDTRILVSDLAALEVANDKAKLYEAVAGDPDVRVPDFELVTDLDGFMAAHARLSVGPDGGQRRLCFKPPYSKGSRGFRYLADGMSRRDLLLNHKPDSKYMALDEFQRIFTGDPDFPALLLMEVLEGEEIDSMVIGDGAGESLLITHKTREKERGGVITQGEQVERPELDTAIKAIVRRIPLRYNFGIQFIGGALLEINPRLSTFMYTEDWVEPYFAIKLALGEWTAGDLRAMQAKVPMGLRMVRYFEQHFWTREAAAAT
ncbi:MAG: ATP-grasp domain-containing protein [Phycisphaerales bacterium]